MVRIERQSIRAFVRKKVKDNPSLVEKKCPQCGRDMSTMYYVWLSEKTGDVYCTFCYAGAVRNKEYDIRGTMTGRLPTYKTVNKSMKNPQEPKVNWALPGLSVDQAVELRRQISGSMEMCKKCSKDCKVPMTKNVTKFFCVEFDYEELEGRLQ